MDKTAALKNAIDFAKKNPDSQQAMQLRKRLESGMYQSELARIKSGVFEDEKEKTKLGKVLEGTKAALGGVAAGVGGIALTGLDFASRKGLFGKKVKAAMEGKPTLQDEFKQEMGGGKYKNVYEVGRFGGEIASLAAPVGAIGRVAERGTQAALGATKFGSKINTVKNISKITRAGVEGTAFTGGMSLQEGKNQSLEEYGLQTGLNMVFPIAGIGLKAIGENVPSRIINSLIKPLQKDFAYGKNPGRTVAELGIKANTFDDLISQIGEKQEEVGQVIGNALKKSKSLQNINLSDVINPIEEAIASANRSPRTNAALIARLEDTKADLLDNIMTGTGPQDLKKLVGDLTKWTGNASDDKAINMSLKRTYGRIANKMDDVLSKELSEAEYSVYKKAQEQYGDLISAKNASIYRDKLLERQDLISFGAKNMGVLGALTTAIATGGTAIPTILAGLGGVVIDKAMATPMFKTRLASILSKLAPKEIETFFQKVPTAKALFRDQQIDDIIKKVEETPNKEGGFVNLSKGTIPENSTKINVYHGTNSKFDDFDVSKLAGKEKDKSSKAGFWFTDSKTTAKSYGKNIKETTLEFKKPKTIDAEGRMYGDFRQELEDAIDVAKKDGNDGLIIKNLSDRKDWGNYESATHYIALDKNIIKPTVLENSETLKIVKDYMEKSAKAKPVIDKIASGVADKHGLIFVEGPLKTEKRIIDKIKRDHSGDFSGINEHIKDGARNTVLATKNKTGQVITDIMKQHTDSVHKPQQAERFNGYEGNIIRVKMKNGILAEIQVHTPEMAVAKYSPEFAQEKLGMKLFNEIVKKSGVEPGLGHKLYELEQKAMLDGNENLMMKYAREQQEYYSHFQ